jgi:hypothetical protein
MLRRIVAVMTVATLVALPGCSSNSELPTVPPPPPPGTVKDAPPVSVVPEGLMKKGKRGRPAPSTPTAL